MKLKWVFDKETKDTAWEEHISGDFRIEIRHVLHLKRYMYTLLVRHNFIGYFKKLSSAKKVAELLRNG